MDNLLAQLGTLGWIWIPSNSYIDTPKLLSKLGPIIPSRHGGAGHHDLRPYRHEEAPPASMSAITGLGPQPMHTDAAYQPRPPRYIALQCVNPGEATCHTHVWSLDVDRLVTDRPNTLTGPTWVVRGDAYNSFYCPVLDVKHSLPRIRFDRCCMAPTIGGAEMIDEAYATLESYAQKYDFEWERNATLIIDNWRCLHARGVGAHLAPSRLLRRWNIGGHDGLGC